MDNQLVVSIIHGTRSLGEKKSECQEWATQLGDFLKKKYKITTGVFHWNGGIRRGHSKQLVIQYEQHLINLCHSNLINTQNAELVILAKSIGGIVAERSIRRIREKDSTFVLSKLIRIATPDFRKNISVSTSNQSINITSRRDWIYRVSIVPLSIFTFFVINHSENLYPLRQYRVDDLSHGELNKNQNFTISGELNELNLFDFYARLILND